MAGIGLEAGWLAMASTRPSGPQRTRSYSSLEPRSPPQTPASPATRRPSLTGFMSSHSNSSANNTTVNTHRPSLPPTPTLTSPPPTSPLPTALHTKPAVSQPPTPPKRSTSWLSNISSKLSAAAHLAPHAQGLSPQSPVQDKANAEPASPTSEKAAGPGFFIATLRRLSTPGGKVTHKELPPGCACPRMILNKNATRERCQLGALDGSKLRKVAFSLDVQIAPQDLEGERKRKEEEKEKDREARRERREARKKAKEIADKIVEEEEAAAAAADAVNGAVDGSPERKVEVPRNPSEEVKEEKVETFRNKPVHRRRTKNPLLIYTRCCELRESTPLKHISAQLGDYNQADGSIANIDLTGHHLNLTDALAFSDFLTLVPVTRLVLERCSLHDESVRVILAGLLAVRVPRGSRNVRRSISIASKGSSDNVDEDTAVIKETKQLYGGFIQRLSLRNNPRIGRDGWSYIALFVHMCHSLKALDLGYNPMPKVLNVRGPQPTKTTSLQGDSAGLFAMALKERLCGTGLDELSLSHCGMNADQVNAIMSAVTESGVKRLGLAGNLLSKESVEMVARWFQEAPVVEGLDISDNDLTESMQLLAASIRPDCSLFGLSLSGCQLTPELLSMLLPALAPLRSLRLLDLSRNRKLFSSQPDSVQALRHYLPHFSSLRKLQLEDTGLSADAAISIAEVLPDVPCLAHLNILSNPLFVSQPQENPDDTDEYDDSALFTALVAASKCSRTLVRIDLQHCPAMERSDTLKSLSKQLLAYCLRNIDTGAVDDLLETTSVLHPVLPPPPLQAQASPTKHRGEEVEEIQLEERDYVNAGTGVVKALGVCLTNTPTRIPANAPFQDIPPTPLTPFAPATPSAAIETEETHRAHQMSKTLLAHARKIKAHVDAKLAPESTSGAVKGGSIHASPMGEMERRRLLFLQDTLANVISKFEKEYPECRLPPADGATSPSQDGSISTLPHTSIEKPHSSQPPADADDGLISAPTKPAAKYDDEHTLRPSLSRRGSEISLRGRMLNQEEGRALRQGVRLGLELEKGEEVAVGSEEEGETEGEGSGGSRRGSDEGDGVGESRKGSEAGEGGSESRKDGEGGNVVVG